MDAQVRGRRPLRRVVTPARRLLWDHLRGGRLSGSTFRRRHPLGPYLLDFFCARARLAVEVDGRGAARAAFLERRGIAVLRFTSREILVNLDGVLRALAFAVAV